MADFHYNDFGGTTDLSARALDNLQCNILRPTGRTACDHVFHRFDSKQAFTSWLKTASAPSPAESTESDLVNIFFTCEGLTRLGLSEAILNRMDPAFRRGTRGALASDKLSDPSVYTWDPTHLKSWHVIELHWRSADRQKAQPKATGAGHTVHVEHGCAIGRDGSPLGKDGGPRYNRFGIRDGTSNPAYTERDHQAMLDAQAPSNGWKWDPRQRLSTLLVSDPLANQPDCFGSYFVFRKYDQDVKRFKAQIAAVADKLAKLLEGPKDSWQWNQYPAFAELTREQFATLSRNLNDPNVSVHDALACDAGVVLTQAIFGVGPDGERPTGGTDNNFNYAGDPDGRRCPFSAHARACNARGGRLAAQIERRAVIARRGVSSGSGVFFWCAQASIGDQFEYIQEKWVNGDNVNLDHHPTPGIDYVIGRPNPEQGNAVEAAQGFSLAIRDAITLRASEYLFAPSRPGMRRLRALGGVQ